VLPYEWKTKIPQGLDCRKKFMKSKPSETYQNRIAQFEQSEKLKRDTEALHKQAGVMKTVAQALNSNNPYLRARIEVLGKYSAWRRNELAEMERVGNINNKHYAEFCHDVAVLGDQYMPI
jgi:putative heme degradation protein